MAELHPAFVMAVCSAVLSPHEYLVPNVANVLAAYVTARAPAGGMEDWVVACECGTRDDDGQRMIACDACARWSHSRCGGVPDDAATPDAFVCSLCHPRLRPGAPC